MALIKNTQTGRLVSRAFEDLGDLKRQAEEVIERAQRQADQIVQEARAREQELIAGAQPQGHAEGYERGVVEGREAGRKQAHAEAIAEYRQQLDRIIDKWTDALHRFESDRAAMLLAAREDLLEFALAMGAKITHRVVETDPAVVVDQLAETLCLVAEPTAVTVSVNPADMRVIKPEISRMVERISQCTHIDLREDPDVGPGGCIVTTGRGRIDATIETQIDRIVATMLGKAGVRGRGSGVREEPRKKAEKKKK